MKKKIAISGLATAALVVGLPVFGQSSDESNDTVIGPVAPAETQVEAVADGDTCPLDNPFGCMFGALQMANPMDPNTWWDGSDGMEHDHTTLMTNPMDPEFVMQVPNPSTHSPLHMLMVNPENWAMFMTPEAIMAMMNPETLVKWADADNYALMMDPQTYAYWAQPGAYMHAMDPAMYTELLNPAAYLTLFKEVATSWAALAEES